MATWADVAAYSVAMLGVGVLNALWLTTRQLRFAPDLLARADSYDGLLSLSARPLGLAVAAPAAALMGEAVPLVVAAVLVVAVNLAVVALRDVRAFSVPRPSDTAVQSPT